MPLAAAWREERSPGSRRLRVGRRATAGGMVVDGGMPRGRVKLTSFRQTIIVACMVGRGVPTPVVDGKDLVLDIRGPAVHPAKLTADQLDRHPPPGRVVCRYTRRPRARREMGAAR